MLGQQKRRFIWIRLRVVGVGRQIYGKLEDYLTQMGILNLNACIASTDVEDAYLTNGSEKFHRALGYQWLKFS